MNRFVFCVIILFDLLPDIAFATESRIIGGRPALLGEIPWQVSLRRSYNDHHFCGGSLITPAHILTAAHCMYYIWGGLLPPFTVSAVVGQLSLPITSGSAYRNASEIFIHPSFDKTTMTNDIAVIKVDLPFDADENPLVKVVPMRNSSISSGKCVVSGWGVEQYKSEIVSEVLLSAEVHVIPFDECNNKYGPAVNLSEGMLCAGHLKGETDACQGDSGGPLLCDGLLTGVISTGSGCGSPDYPGIYSDVVKYIAWITEAVQAVPSSPSSETSVASEQSSNASFMVTLNPKEIPYDISSTSVRCDVCSVLFALIFYVYYTIAC